ncbi:FecR family protein [Horticoccus sp. 23ND18S-11]|uniref:FecR family protein n=1 Tax=Horticoccus sp. 23ND18S-11 TaxID=3391832 RepID=UPI0039C99413
MNDSAAESNAGGDRPALRLEREATEWFFRRDGGFTAADERAFARWLAQNEGQAAAFAEIERTWRVLGATQDRVAVPIGIADLPARRRSAVAQVALRAAAVVALGVGSWALWPRSDGTRAWWGSAGASFAEQAATESGGLRRLDLPDGSTLTLNASSAVDVQFSRSERRVRLLRGEAHFTVAPNSARPFVVEANGVAVKAVGTAFNVRLQSASVDVLVTEGKVRVDRALQGDSLLVAPVTAAAPDFAPPESDRVLRQGERVEIPLSLTKAPAAAPVATVSAGEIEAALAWQKRWLDYTDAPLSEIVADFNRFNQHRLVIADATLASRRFGGTFPAGDHASLVQLLEKTFGVVVERRERETILRLP